MSPIGTDTFEPSCVSAISSRIASVALISRRSIAEMLEAGILVKQNEGYATNLDDLQVKFLPDDV